MIAIAGIPKPVILVIDDNPDDRFKIRWMLSKDQQVIFHEAQSASEGIQAWREFDPDLVLLDLHLGDADGSDVLRQVKDLHSDAIVVIVSELPLPARADQLRQVGAQQFLPKEKLTQTVLRGVIEQARQRVLRRQRNANNVALMDEKVHQLIQSMAPSITALLELGKKAEADDQPASRLLGGLTNRYAAQLSAQLDALLQWTELANVDNDCQSVTVEQLLQWFEDHDTRVTSEIAPALRVSAPWARLTQCLTFLLSNAHEHNANRADEVQIDIQADEQYVYISMINSNPRLSPVWHYESEKLFEMGMLRDNPNPSALGLGLAKVARLLADTVVKVSLAISPKHGFCIRLSLPIGRHDEKK